MSTFASLAISVSSTKDFPESLSTFPVCNAEILFLIAVSSYCSFGRTPQSFSVPSSKTAVRCRTPLTVVIFKSATLVPVSPLSPFTGVNVICALSPLTKFIVNVLLPSALSVTVLLT